MASEHSRGLCTELETMATGRPVKTKFLHQDLPLVYWPLSDIDAFFDQLDMLNECAGPLQ